MLRDVDAGAAAAPEAAKRAAVRKAELAQLGIFYDDEYDYSQHLKDRGGGGSGTELIAADPKVMVKLNPDVAKYGLDLPLEALPSTTEEEVGMLNRAAPHTGPRLDWDPDIVAALDDGLDLTDEANVLLDDFVLQANGEGPFADIQDDDGSGLSDGSGLFGSDEDGDFEDGDYEDEDEDRAESGAIGHHYGLAGRGMREQDRVRGYARALADDADDLKSRFTEYSMTSSILPRSEALQVHDSRFEKLYEQYDDDQIGALEDGEDDIGGVADLTLYQGVFDEHLQHQAELRGSYLDNIPTDTRKVRQLAERLERSTLEEKEDEDTIPVALEPRPDKEWDCESILSTRSNIYNHPTKISERTYKIVLDKRGMPVGPVIV